MSPRRSAAWPKALAVIMEEPAAAPAYGMRILSLMAEAARCRTCGWRGRLRGPADPGLAQVDAEYHAPICPGRPS